jgi:hypothetical protein
MMSVRRIDENDIPLEAQLRRFYFQQQGGLGAMLDLLRRMEASRLARRTQRHGVPRVGNSTRQSSGVALRCSQQHVLHLPTRHRQSWLIWPQSINVSPRTFLIVAWNGYHLRPTTLP